MPTVDELHALVDQNETQQNPTDRIFGSEVRQVDHAVIDEMARRGMINGIDVDNFIFYTRAETGFILIPNDGIYAPLETDALPDYNITYPSGEEGWLWEKVIDVKPKAVVTEIKELEYMVGTDMDGPIDLQSTFSHPAMAGKDIQLFIGSMLQSKKDNGYGTYYAKPKASDTITLTGLQWSSGSLVQIYML